MDVPVRSYLTLLTDDQVSRIRARWEREKRTRAEQAARAAAPTPPPRRRRTAEPVAAAAAAPAAEAGAPAAVRRRVRVADAEADGALNGSAHEDGEHQTAGDSAIAAHAEVPDLSVPTPVDTPQPERAAPEPEVTAPARPRPVAPPVAPVRDIIPIRAARRARAAGLVVVASGAVDQQGGRPTTSRARCRACAGPPTTVRVNEFITVATWRRSSRSRPPRSWASRSRTWG
jgi:hypothetical protein